MLSVAMIVKNEEEVLDRCLNSIVGLWSELIIVDTGSTDNTIKIAEKHGAKIHRFKWIDDFAAARNFSFKQCTQKYIMWLDADDIVKSKDYQLIQNYLQDDNWDALLCRYIYSHDANDNPELTLRRHRIVRNDPSLVWYDEVHEYLAFNFNQVVTTDIDIHHYRTSKGFEKNIGRNLKILKKMHEKQASERHTYYYARELADNNLLDESISVFTDYLNKKQDWEGNIINAYQKLTQIYISLNETDKALKTAFEGISYNPHYIELYNLIASIYYTNQDWLRVIRFCEMAITIPKPDSLHSVLPREYDFIPYDRLCFAYFQIGEHQKSYNANLKALESNPCGTDLERCSYNDSFLKNILNEKRNGEGKKLNLGCGSKKIEDYTNCDVVKTQYSDEVFPLTNIPYTDGSISAIYCEHVLEHLSHQESHQAISEMSRVLKQGGELQLFIPDLEKCCEKYLTSNDMTNGFDAKEWFKYTIFGFQKDANGVPADYQFHKTGFSKNDITTLLEQNDFVIDYCENY